MNVHDNNQSANTMVRTMTNINETIPSVDSKNNCSGRGNDNVSDENNEFLQCLTKQFQSNESIDSQFKKILLPVLNIMHEKYKTIKKHKKKTLELFILLNDWTKEKKRNV